LRIPNAHMNESCHAYEWVMSHIWWISDAVRFSFQTYKSRSDPESKREMQNYASSQISSLVREDVKHTRTNSQRKTVLCVGHTSFRFANKTQKKKEVYDQRKCDYLWPSQMFVQVTHMNEACHAHTCEGSHKHMYKMPHSYVRHHQILTCDMSVGGDAWHDSLNSPKFQDPLALSALKYGSRILIHLWVF